MPRSVLPGIVPAGHALGEAIEVRIPGVPPPKGQIGGRGARQRDRWRRWLDYRSAALWAIRRALGPKPWPVPSSPVRAVVTWYPPDRRRRDWDNACMKPVLDVLQEAGLLADDTWADLPRVELLVGGIDRADPRVEVQLFAHRQEDRSAS